MVDGGMCRRPGPSFRGNDGLGDVGRRSEGISSPGSTSCVAIGIVIVCQELLRSIVEYRGCNSRERYDDQPYSARMFRISR
jgi:hypothetical protein